MGLFKGIRNIVKIFLLALITVIALAVYIKIDYSKALDTPNSDDTSKVTMEVESGETTEAILNSLAEKGLLKESWIK